MTRDQLKPFCHKCRNTISEPFSQLDRTYATDGRILLSIPRQSEISENILAPEIERRLQVNERVAAAYSLNEWEPLPAFPYPQFIPCSDCGGKEGGCEECDGTGRDPVAERVRVGRGKRVINNHYLALLSTLPGVLIAPNAHGDMEHMVFRFDGGFGILAAMSPAT